MVLLANAAAFANKAAAEGIPPRELTYMKFDDVQVIREPVIDREEMTFADNFYYQVMPLFRPEEVGRRDVDALCDELYNLPLADILGFVSKVGESLAAGGELNQRGMELTAPVAEMPLDFLEAPDHPKIWELRRYLLAPRFGWQNL